MAAAPWEPKEDAVGCGPGLHGRWRPRLGVALRSLREHLCLAAAGARASADKVPGTGLSFVMRGQWGGGERRSGRAGSLSCYLFSMFCICKLREVKLASRSVTSSTCGMKPRLCYGVPPGPPSSTTGMEGRHCLSPQGMWWLHHD